MHSLANFKINHAFKACFGSLDKIKHKRTKRKFINIGNC